jgi:hypothetical protein
VSAIHVPHQTTGFDCGVACLLYAEKCAAGWPRADVERWTGQADFTAHRRVLHRWLHSLAGKSLPPSPSAHKRSPSLVSSMAAFVADEPPLAPPRLPLLDSSLPVPPPWVTPALHISADDWSLSGPLAVPSSAPPLGSFLGSTGSFGLPVLPPPPLSPMSPGVGASRGGRAVEADPQGHVSAASSVRGGRSATGDSRAATLRGAGKGTMGFTPARGGASRDRGGLGRLPSAPASPALSLGSLAPRLTSPMAAHVVPLGSDSLVPLAPSAGIDAALARLVEAPVGGGRRPRAGTWGSLPEEGAVAGEDDSGAGLLLAARGDGASLDDFDFVVEAGGRCALAGAAAATAAVAR